MTGPDFSGPPVQQRILAESAPDPILTINEDSVILYANLAAERVFGYTREELIGHSLTMLMPEPIRQHHLDGLARYIATGERRIEWQRIRVPIISGSGAEIPVEVSFGEFEWEGRRLFSGFLRDVTERVASDAALAAANSKLYEQAVELEQQVEAAQTLADDLARSSAESTQRALAEARSGHRAKLLLELSTALNGAVRESEVADLILEIGMHAVGASAGSLALLSRQGDGGEFEVIRSRGFSADVVASYVRFPLRRGRPLSDAVLTGAPVLLESREATARRYPNVSDLDHEALAMVPVFTGGNAIAAIAFSFSEPQEFDAVTETFLRTIGEQCAQAIERARLYDARNRQVERSGFLADASRLLSSSLNFEITLNLLAQSAVPMLGDWCAVDIITDPALREWPPQVSRLAVVHVEPGKRALALELARRFPTDWSAPHGLPSVIRFGNTLFLPVIDDGVLASFAQGPEHLAMLKELKLSSAIIVPLIARGLTLGALTLVMSESGRRYTEDDVLLAQDMAGRAAVAIDNARLFREAQAQHEVAEAARATAASASKAKSNFLATMSHEIRTPINAVLGYSELLSLEIAGALNAEQRAQIERIRSSAGHLLILVNEILDLAKIESGTLSMDSRIAVAGDSVNAAISLVGPLAKVKNVELTERCGGDCSSRYVGDENRVRQILANLIGNAIKFTNPGGAVTVTCAVGPGVPGLAALDTAASYVAFRIADTGVGIAPNQLETIFDAFVQGESADSSPYTREQAGTGLGLAISRQLAHRMAGEITVESKRGVGSVFTLFLPRPEADSRAVVPGQDPG